MQAAAERKASSRRDPGHLVEVEGDAARALNLAVAVDAHQRLRLLVEGILERDDDELVVALLGPLADEVCDARDVDVVESCSGLGVGLGSVVRVRVRVRVRASGQGQGQG